MKKVEDISDVTGANIDMSDISNIGDVIDSAVNDINPITILNDENFLDTTGISDSDSSTNEETDQNQPSGWIVTSAECVNRDECDKVKQTIVESIDEIKEVTDDKVKFGTVQTSDRTGIMIHII